MKVNQCFAMNFRHGTSIMHMDPTRGPLSDKSDPPSQFAGYGPEFVCAYGLLYRYTMGLTNVRCNITCTSVCFVVA